MNIMIIRGLGSLKVKYQCACHRIEPPAPDTRQEPIPIYDSAHDAFEAGWRFGRISEWVCPTCARNS